LHVACESNKIECVIVLLNIGVDVNVTSLAGITPLYLARAAKAKEVEVLLVEKNARLETDKDKFVFSSTIMSSAQLFHAPPELTLSKMPVKSRRPGEMETSHFSY
jgi:ankyrin repeat protein